MSIISPSSRAPYAAGPGKAIVDQSEWKTNPSRLEILALCLATSVIFVSFVALFRNYAAAVDNFGNSSAYMTLASAIRHWDFDGVVVKQF